VKKLCAEFPSISASSANKSKFTPNISNALAERSENNYADVHDLFMSGGHNRCSAVGALFAHGSRETSGDADEKTKRSLALHS
jgi:hypothetical protein